MSSKTGRNQKCTCGSGKKYKHCCSKKDQAKASVETTQKRPSMRAYSAKIFRDGKEEVLFNGDIELSLNSVSGDEIGNSSAEITVPQDGGTPIIKTIGNASVSNNKQISKIALADNKRKLKTKSDSGLWATAKIGLQKNTGQDYFQLFFGVEGVEEKKNDSGEKNRPHIDFYPSGGGKYIRLSEYRCSLNTVSHFDQNEDAIFPSLALIELVDHNEVLELNFEYQSNSVILVEINFRNKTERNNGEHS